MAMKQVSVSLMAGVLLAFASAGAAEIEEWYIAPGALYIDDDKNRGVQDEWAGGQLTVGYAFADHWNIEVFANSLSLTDNFAGNRDQDLMEFGSNLLIMVDRDMPVAPFLLFGASIVDTDVDTPSGLSSPLEGQNWALSGGIGLMLRFGESKWSLRADYRVRKENSGGDNAFNQDLTDTLMSVGFEYALGERTPRTFDSDRDGVDDNLDRCPNTPAGTMVDAYGCEVDDDSDGVVNSSDRCPNTPRGASVDANGCELDGDGDGVVNSRDRCPNTPAGASVDANGCELDDDGDGVVNSRDRCPDTQAGVRVDVNGCEITDVIRLPGVNFETNSDRLIAGAEQVLNDAAATLMRYPDLVVEVAGHTDSDGSAAYNESLSARRASTVLDYLVSRGASAGNLTARGYGETRPIADNATREGKAANRRVELRILNE